jgi:hypothetical protein
MLYFYLVAENLWQSFGTCFVVMCISRVAGWWVFFHQQVRVCQVGVACSKACNNDLLSSVLLLCR